MTAGANDVAQQAEALLRAGEAAAACQLLERAAGAQDSSAAFTLGLWYLEGGPVPRDLARSRDYFLRATRLGHALAARVLTAFLATGTGGRPDWAAALKLLAARARPEPRAARELALVEAMALDAVGNPRGLVAGETLSERPHVTVFRRLLDPQECAFLCEAAAENFAPSRIVDPVTRAQRPDEIRTSEVATFPLADESPAVHAINRRIARHAGIAWSHGEPLQVLRYGIGQQYRPHFDGLPNARNQRVATMLVYLNDDYAGGETDFPRASIRFRGEPGDALLFHNATVDGQVDPLSLHAGLPVTRGVKLLASRWMRARAIDPASPASLA